MYERLSIVSTLPRNTAATISRTTNAERNTVDVLSRIPTLSVDPDSRVCSEVESSPFTEAPRMYSHTNHLYEGLNCHAPQFEFGQTGSTNRCANVTYLHLEDLQPRVTGQAGDDYVGSNRVVR